MDARQALEEVLDEISGTELSVWDDVTEQMNGEDTKTSDVKYAYIRHVDHETVFKLTLEVVESGE